MVKDLILPSRLWNLYLIHHKLSYDVNSILFIHLAGSGVPNELCWHYSKVLHGEKWVQFRDGSIFVEYKYLFPGFVISLEKDLTLSFA